jgi:hypothetical protein
LDGVTGDIDENVLGSVNGEVNPEGDFWAVEYELVFEVLGRIVDPVECIRGDQYEFVFHRGIGQVADTVVVELGHYIAGVAPEEEGLVRIAVILQLVKKVIFIANSYGGYVLELLEVVG